MDLRPWHMHYDYCVPTTIRYPKIPIHVLLSLGSKTFPDKDAFDFFGTTMTFWELRERSVSMADALIKLGVKKGDRVGIHLPNCPQYIIAYLGTLIAGGIVTNMNPMYTTDEIKHIVGSTGVSTLFTFDNVLENVKPVLTDFPVERMIVTRVTDFIEGFPQSTAEELGLDKSWHHFSTVLESGSPVKMPQIEFAQDDPAMIQFTGGTTGVPKGAVLTQSNLVAATMQCAIWGDAVFNRKNPVETNSLSILPFFHVYGAIVGLNSALYTGRTQILVPRFEINELLGILSKHKDISFFPAVPTLITAIINAPGAVDLNLRRKIGLLNSGGGPMPTELIEKVDDMGIVYSEGWGMSETTSLGVANPILGKCKPGSIGIPFPDTEIRIVDVDDGETEVKPGEPGELVIKSPLVMKEYWNNPEETALQLKDGWLSTGDVVVMDEDGYLFIVDRKKDMVIAGGYNIYPREIDEVLYQHPKILEAAALGIPDKYRGETIKAFVVLKPGEEMTADDVIGFCREKLAPYKAPKFVEFRNELPKSAVGKILRKILRQEEEAKAKE